MKSSKTLAVLATNMAATALEVLLREEHPDMPSEFFAALGWQTRDVGNIPLDDRGHSAENGRRRISTRRRRLNQANMAAGAGYRNSGRALSANPPGDQSAGRP